MYHFEAPRKRPNERNEYDWSNLLSLKDLSFNISDCDTQGVKNDT